MSGVKCFGESGRGYGMPESVSQTLRVEGENRPSRPSNCIVHIIDPIETYIGQIGTTERLGNAFWREVAYTLQTAGGDASPTIIQQKIAEGRAK